MHILDILVGLLLISAGSLAFYFRNIVPLLKKLLAGALLSEISWSGIFLTLFYYKRFSGFRFKKLFKYNIKYSMIGRDNVRFGLPASKVIYISSVEALVIFNQKSYDK